MPPSVVTLDYIYSYIPIFGINKRKYLNAATESKWPSDYSPNALTAANLKYHGNKPLKESDKKEKSHYTITSNNYKFSFTDKCQNQIRKNDKRAKPECPVSNYYSNMWTPPNPGPYIHTLFSPQWPMYARPKYRRSWCLTGCHSLRLRPRVHFLVRRAFAQVPWLWRCRAK